eukprot:10226131-Ditylum_brightwellii.AAC.1
MSKLEELKQQCDAFLPAINTLVEKQLDDRNIGGTMLANVMKLLHNKSYYQLEQLWKEQIQEVWKRLEKQYNQEMKRLLDGTMLEIEKFSGSCWTVQRNT